MEQQKRKTSFFAFIEIASALLARRRIREREEISTTVKKRGFLNLFLSHGFSSGQKGVICM
jgi:hypothetical protein